MEEVTKKKVSKVKRFFERFFLLISILFLLALVYFQLPWKLILFLAFIFYIDRLIPKRHRKKAAVFCWAVLLGVVIWVFLPEEQEGWRPYICYDKIVKHEQQLRIPDEENAAIVYYRLFESVEMDGFCDSVRDVNEALLDTFWNSSDYPETAQLLNEYSIVNDQVFEAVKLNRCYFPLLKADFQKPENYDEVAGLWYHYSDYARHLRYIGKFILLSANNDVSEGKYDLGLKKYFSVLQMARHLRQQSELIDILVGMAFERKTFRCINRFLITCDLPPDYRRNIKKILGDVTYDWKADMQNVFEREKLRNKSLMYAIFYQINESGSIRYNRDPNSTLPAIIHICPTLEDPDQFQILLNSHPQAQSYLHKKATKASLLLTSFFVPLDINKTEKIFDENLASHDEMLSSDYYWSKEDKRFMFTWTTVKINFSFFSKMMFEGIMAEYYERIHEIFLETRAAKQSTQIIVALEQYENKTGHWPESLDVISDQVPDEVLIDPMNGRTFVYRTEGDSFIFYSRGKNDEDEYEQLVRWYTDDPNEMNLSLRRPDDTAIWPQIKN